MPRVLKDPRLRQRRNKVTTAANLAGEAIIEIPALAPRRPDTKRRWHKWTLECWKIISESPMITELLAADVPGLIRLAILWDEFAREAKVTLAAEIRQQEQRFGLSPLDRRRLQWEIQRVDPTRRKSETVRSPSRADDPRTFLHVAPKVQ